MIEYQFKPALDTVSAFKNLYEIISLLRSENGCPYDRAQSEKSSLGNLIDEAYEYLEAVNQENRELCREEIGDVLLNVVTILQIHEDKNDFTSVEAINELCDKLVRRHQHVFGSVDAKDENEALSSWNQAKEKEGHESSIKAVLSHVSSAMPPLEKCYEVSKKLGRQGFDWASIEDVIDKVYEELDEVKEAIQEGKPEHTEEEVGDVFWALVNLARWLKIRPDQAIEKVNNKITRRFCKLSDIATERSIPVDKEHMGELDAIWEEIKKEEKKEEF